MTIIYIVVLGHHHPQHQFDAIESIVFIIGNLLERHYYCQDLNNLHQSDENGAGY